MNRRELIFGTLLAPLIRPIMALLPAKLLATNTPLGFAAGDLVASQAMQHSLKADGLGFVTEYELLRWDKYGVFYDLQERLDRKNAEANAIINEAVYAIQD